MNNSYKTTEKKSEFLREKYDVVHHPSGLDIYVFPKKMTNTYALFSTHYGSVDNRFRLEGDDEITEVPDGIAHFLEHKMFTNEDGSDSFDTFSLYGADANAYTSYDKTVFLFSCTEHFSECLAELIEFVTRPYFTDASVAKEQGIIGQEIGMYDDSPGTRSYYGMLEGLYKNHDIRKNICGSVKSISKITPELLYRCHKVFYNLSNMALVVCGDITTDEVMKIADAHLPKTANINKIIRYRADEPREVNKSTIKQYMQLAKPIFDLGIKDPDIPQSPKERAGRDAAMSIINDLLFSQTGELYNSLYRDGLISPGLNGSYTISDTFAFNSVSGEAQDPEKVTALIRKYIHKKQKEDFGRENFERCKKVFYASFVREFDSTEDIANNLLSFTFDGYELFDYTDIISSITYEEITELFRNSFRDEYFTLSAVYPLEQKSKGE